MEDAHLQDSLREKVLNDSVLYLWRRAIYLMSVTGHKAMNGQNQGIGPRVRGMVADFKRNKQPLDKLETFMTKNLAIRLIKDCGYQELPLLPDNSIGDKITGLLEGIGISNPDEVESLLGLDASRLASLKDEITLEDLDNISLALGIAPGAIVNNWYSRDLVLSRAERMAQRLEFFQITEDEFRDCIGIDDFEIIQNVREDQIPRGANAALIRSYRILLDLIIKKYPEIKDMFEGSILAENNRVVDVIVDYSLKGGVKMYDTKDTQKVIKARTVNRNANIKAAADLQAQTETGLQENEIEECVEMSYELAPFNDLKSMKEHFSYYASEDNLLILANKLKRQLADKGMRTSELADALNMSVKGIINKNISKHSYVKIRSVEYFLAGVSAEEVKNYIVRDLEHCKDILTKYNTFEDYITKRKIKDIVYDKLKLLKRILIAIDRVESFIRDGAPAPEDEISDVSHEEILSTPEGEAANYEEPLPVSEAPRTDYIDALCGQSIDKVREVLDKVNDDVFLAIWKRLESLDREKSLEIFPNLSAERIVMILNSSDLDSL